MDTQVRRLVMLSGLVAWPCMAYVVYPPNEEWPHILNNMWGVQKCQTHMAIGREDRPVAPLRAPT